MMPVGRGFAVNSITNRQKFNIPGVVLEHLCETTGWWIFKQTRYGVLVQLDREVADSMYGKHKAFPIGYAHAPSEPLRDTVRFWIEEGVNEFPVGAKVVMEWFYTPVIFQIGDYGGPLGISHLSPQKD